VTAVPVTDDGPRPGVPASDTAAPRRHRPGSGFWAVAFAFLVVMAVATLPSPLYGLYRTRDHLSALAITVVFAIFAASTIAVLLRDSSVTGRIGRRDTMLASVATMMVALGVGPLIAGCLAQWVAQPLTVPYLVFIALYVGLSVPVIGAGIALDLGASAPNTVLGFAILVGLGVGASGWAMLRRRPGDLGTVNS
jgi:hypothetical protein